MRHISPDNTEGMTLVEVMIVAFIMSIVMAGLLFALGAGRKNSSVVTAQVDVQGELRRVGEWIAKDVRQARGSDIATSANNPSSSHIKFRVITGYNVSTGTLTLSSYYIEYTYSSSAQTITRSDSSTTQTWTFNHIIQPPFYTRTSTLNTDGTYNWIIDPTSEGADSPVMQTGNLVIKLVGQQTVEQGTTPVYTLIDEVKIRND